MGIFKRRTSGIRCLRHTMTPGIKIGRYESGLDAVWAWRELAHLLVVERPNYGAGENLVARVYRTVTCPKVLLWSKGESGWRESTDQEIYGLMDTLEKLYSLACLATERAERIEDGEDIPDMLVALPELHDATYTGDPEGRQFVADLVHLLTVGPAGRIHVLANIRSWYFSKAYLPQELLDPFSGLLVLGQPSRLVMERLGLTSAFESPHGRLGDLGDDSFWPLNMRIR